MNVNQQLLISYLKSRFDLFICEFVRHLYNENNSLNLKKIFRFFWLLVSQHLVKNVCISYVSLVTTLNRIGTIYSKRTCIFAHKILHRHFQYKSTVFQIAHSNWPVILQNHKSAVIKMKSKRAMASIRNPIMIMKKKIMSAMATIQRQIIPIIQRQSFETFTSFAKNVSSKSRYLQGVI